MRTLLMLLNPVVCTGTSLLGLALEFVKSLTAVHFVRWEGLGRGEAAAEPPPVNGAHLDEGKLGGLGRAKWIGELVRDIGC